MRRLLSRTLFGVGATLVALGGVGVAGVRANTTPSMPVGLWWVSPFAEPVGRGSIASVCLPEQIAADAVRLGILMPGRCPGDAEPVLKRIAAVAGDKVRVSAWGVLVNDVLTSPPARPASVRAMPNGRYRVADGEMWLLGPHEDGWDSRYFGPVPLSGVLGVGRPLLTWNGD